MNETAKQLEPGDAPDAPPATKTTSRPWAKAFVGTFAASLVVQACSLLQGILVARLLGATGRGQLAAALLWPTCFAALGLLGIDTAIARRAGQQRDLAVLSRTALLVGAVTSLLTTIVAGPLIPVLLPNAERGVVPLAWIALVLVPLNHMVLGLQAVELGAGRFKLFNLSRTVLYPVYLGALAVMWALGIRSVGWVIAAQLASNAAALALLVAARWRDLTSTRELMRPQTIVREGLRFGLVTIGNLVHQRVDQILLVWLLPVRELGIYVVGLSAASIVSSPAGAMAALCFTDAAQSGSGEGFPVLARGVRRTAVLCSGAAIAVAPLLPLLLPLFYGREFEGSTHVAMTIVVGSVLAGLAQILDQALRGQGRPYAGLLGRVGAIAVAFGTGLALTRVLGVMGMALGFVASQLCYLVVMALSAKRHYQGARLSELLPRWADARQLVEWGWRTLAGKLGFAR